uniref:Uncharacterized protein n=1 Tax=Aegilops tauschii subsp. strangulata TaxID=200361 RepID=A0A453P5I8_AEGTS
GNFLFGWQVSVFLVFFSDGSFRVKTSGRCYFVPHV